MYFIISHFTKNLGTTDYLLEYFRKNKISYLFLRHPFQSENELSFSELIKFDGKEERIIKRYRKYSNFVLEMLRNIFLTFYCSLRYFRGYTKVIGFGGFNIFSVLWTRIFGKETYFWGVDYSRKRFGNKILNQIYRFFETLGCFFSCKIISSSERQLQARIQYHSAKKEKSFLINNGIFSTAFNKDFQQYKVLSFFYLGSLTPQHGILDFINHFYVKKKIKNICYIIGGGELEEQLKTIIQQFGLEKVVIFLGRRNRAEIQDFLLSKDERLIGIAPYSDAVNDHVYYGDSLKIREYLGYNLPFLVSDIAYVADDLKKFGVIYQDFDQIDFQMLEKFTFDITEKDQVLKKYTWDNLFSKLF